MDNGSIIASFRIERDLYQRVENACKSLKISKATYYIDEVKKGLKKLEERAKVAEERKEYIARKGRYSMIEDTQYIDELRGNKDFERWVSEVNSSKTNKPFKFEVWELGDKKYINPSASTKNKLKKYKGLIVKNRIIKIK